VEHTEHYCRVGAIVVPTISMALMVQETNGVILALAYSIRMVKVPARIITWSDLRAYRPYQQKKTEFAAPAQCGNIPA